MRLKGTWSDPNEGLLSPELRGQISDFWRGLVRGEDVAQGERKPSSTSEGVGAIVGKYTVHPAKAAAQSADLAMKYMPYAMSNPEAMEAMVGLTTNAFYEGGMGARGGNAVLSVARPTAKGQVYRDLVKYWGKPTDKAEMLATKERFAPYRQALDVIPQKDLDSINAIYAETRFGQLNAEEGGLSFGETLGRFYPETKDVRLSSHLAGRHSDTASDVLSHEIAHARTARGYKLSSIPQEERVRNAFMNTVTKTDKFLGYETNPREIFAHTKAAAQMKQLKAEGLFGKRNIDEAILERISDEAHKEAESEMIRRVVIDKPWAAKEAAGPLMEYKDKPAVKGLLDELDQFYKYYENQSLLPDA